MRRLIPALLLCCLLSPVRAADVRGHHTDYALPICRTFLETASAY
jgi:hypothetical protein